MVDLDVVFVGDFRFPGGTSTAIAHEIRALTGKNFSVGLIQNDSQIWRKSRPWHQDIDHHVESGTAVVLNNVDKIICGLLVVHNPLILEKTPRGLPHVDANCRVMVAHHPVCDARGRLYYDPWTVDRVAHRCFGGNFVWAPNSPVCRASFGEVGAEAQMLDHDWPQVFFVDDWGDARSSLQADHPVIGRHSRPERCKWPATRAELLKVCPDDPRIEVRLLGVGKALDDLVQSIPSNWTTFEFNEIEPREFLRSIDFFVYYHHPDWVEAFGRTIAEAAASGAVVIVPPYFEETFGEAAIYREADGAIKVVHELFENEEKFQAQSRRGREAIDQLYGPRRYLEEIERILIAGRAQDQAALLTPRVHSGLGERLRRQLRRMDYRYALAAKKAQKHYRRRRKKTYKKVSKTFGRALSALRPK
jgi:hypothetical protein